MIADRNGSAAACMSVVLATDTYATLGPVITALQNQSAGSSLEIVIVAPAGSLDAIDWRALNGFAAVRVVNVAAPLSLAAARAAGVKAATAPLVFIGETHCFPRPRMCAELAAAFTDERCAAVVPAIINANPASALSWASYLTDYGAWGPGRPAGVIHQTLLYNGAYRRAVLTALDERLDELLDVSSEALWPILNRQGYHARFLPDAQTDHVNANRVAAILRIRFFTGVLIGARRANRWSIARRIAYLLATPLVPVVLAWRIRAIVPFAAPDRRLPRGTMIAVALGVLTKAIGEALGYVGLVPASAEDRLTENELHKLRHIRVDAPMSGL